MGMGGGGESAGPRRLNWNDGQHAYGTPVAAGPHARSIYSAAYLEDTPITRAPRGTMLSGGGGGRTLWDSPGFARRAVTPDGEERRDRRGERERDGDEGVPMETEGVSFSSSACALNGGADALRCVGVILSVTYSISRHHYPLTDPIVACSFLAAAHSFALRSVILILRYLHLPHPCMYV